ncbi:MAG: hypothetical protein KA354_24535 [Phycisphaerae bacterium]|nr:hypothetical protein [Phycisphaerae bacterium]
MRSSTQTILCEDCKRLMDVLETLIDETGKESEAHALKCYRSSGHRIKVWNHPGPCPRCGQTMTRGEVTVMWD